MSWFKRSKPEDALLIGKRTLPGIPDAFTGRDTTYAKAREMAVDVRDNTYRTQVEKGLAITLVTVIDDFNQYLANRSGDARG